MHLTTEQERTLVCRGATVPTLFKHNEDWRVFKEVQIALAFAVNAL